MMAKLPTTIRVLRSDSEGINIQNTFNQAIYDAVMGQLTFTENVRCQIKELTFPTLSTYSSHDWTNIIFPVTIRTKPIGLELLQIYKTDENVPIYDPVYLDWQYINGNMVIRWIAGLEDETNYFLRVMVK